MNFNGPMPGLDEQYFVAQSSLPRPDFSLLDSFQRTQNDPAGLKLFNPQLFETPSPKVFDEPPPFVIPERRTVVPPPKNRPPVKGNPAAGALSY